MADAIEDGLAALRDGDDDTATSKLGEAVRMAEAAGDHNKLDLLEAVVEIVDAVTGTVKLRGDAAVIDEMKLDAGSTKTERVQFPE